jgi:hypothetical protein
MPAILMVGVHSSASVRISRGNAHPKFFRA